MTGELVALLDGKEVGRVHRDARGRLTFVYADEWRNAAEPIPYRFQCRSQPKSMVPLCRSSLLMGASAG